MKKEGAKFGRKVNYVFQIAAVGGITGGLAGVLVTCFVALAEMCEEFSRGYYGFFLAHPAFIPLLFVALFVGAIVIGGVLRFLPVLRGSGFAQTEGASRGILRFKWYEALAGGFASCLFTVFMGLSAGFEGPAAMIGGAGGSAVSRVLKRNAFVRRYEITGGACAGLAVALNAPLTGITFAYEEAHKRFTPEVFVCSFISVVVAIVVRTLLAPHLGLSAGPFFAEFALPADTGLLFCVYALAVSLVVSLAGVGFYFLVFFARKLLKKLTFWKGLGKYLLPFLFAGAAGLITAYAMGGGLFFVESLAHGAEGLVPVFSSPVWATLLIVVLLKAAASVLNLGTDLPCCASVPMLAIGGGLGALLSLVCTQIGMDAELADALVVLSMIAFFTTVVKAPVTGLVMTVELTWSFTFLLPAVLCVAVAYLVGDVFRTEPLYEKLLDEMIEERKGACEYVRATLTVTDRAAGREIRDILWPFSALVVSLQRGEETLIPKGATQLFAGDILTVEGKPEDRREYLASLEAVVGELVSVSGQEENAEKPADEGETT